MQKKILYKLGIIVVKFVQIFDVRVAMIVMTYLMRFRGVKLTGLPRYVSPLTRFDNASLITIGERCVVSDHVIFLTHDYSFTTAKIAGGVIPPTDIAIIKNITVGDNVFIGMGSIVMPGTVLGDNTIVGAGAVVRGQFESNSVIIGNPAKRLCSVDDVLLKWDGRDHNFIIDRK